MRTCLLYLRALQYAIYAHDVIYFSLHKSALTCPGFKHNRKVCKAAENSSDHGDAATVFAGVTPAPSLSSSCPPSGQAVTPMKIPLYPPPQPCYFPPSLQSVDFAAHRLDTCDSICHTSRTRAMCAPKRGRAQLGSE